MLTLQVFFLLSLSPNRQKERFADKIARFNALPRSSQESVLVHILTKNEEAAKAVAENQDLLKAVGFDFDYPALLNAAKDARSKLIKHTTL